MIEMTTSSGYKVCFKDFLDTRGYRAIQRASVAETTITPSMTAEEIQLPGSVGLDAQDVALKHLLLSVTLPDGTMAADPVEAVNAMPFSDGTEVFDRIDQLTRVNDGSGEEAKNAPSASSAS